jgi:hypothetical protein
MGARAVITINVAKSFDVLLVDDGLTVMKDAKDSKGNLGDCRSSYPVRVTVPAGQWNIPEAVAANFWVTANSSVTTFNGGAATVPGIAAMGAPR